MTSNSAPYSYQSTRSDPNNKNVCKPVAIISQDKSLTLITCLQTNQTQDGQFICQHQKLQSDVSQIPITALIQDLQKRACCVYAVSQDGTSLQEQTAEYAANSVALTELKPEDLAEVMDINNEQASQSIPDDLDYREVNEMAIQGLLLQGGASSELSISQQGASASLNQAASTSTGALNQGASTSEQHLSLATLLKKPSSKVELNQQQKTKLNSIMPSQKRTIYCLLDILENNKRPLTKVELINLIKLKYMNFDSIKDSGSCFNHAFSDAIKLDLVDKSQRHAGIVALTYTGTKYGLAALEFLEQDISPTLKPRTSVASYSADGKK